MNKFCQTSVLLIISSVICFSCQTSFGQNSYAESFQYNSFQYNSQPSWYPYVIARGEDRVVIQNMPMEMRPYRPMHFWGNTVRRSYHGEAVQPMVVASERGTFAIRRR